MFIKTLAVSALLASTAVVGIQGSASADTFVRSPYVGAIPNVSYLGTPLEVSGSNADGFDATWTGTYNGFTFLDIPSRKDALKDCSSGYKNKSKCKAERRDIYRVLSASASR